MIVGVVLANGTGTRFGTDLPKQFQFVEGNKRVIDYSINALYLSKKIDKILVMIEDKYKTMVQTNSKIVFVEGGSTRNKTVKKALDYIKNNYKCNKVIILESARPMISRLVIDNYLELLDQYDAVITGQKIVDSLGGVDLNYVNRDDYYLIQAPEAFDFNMLYQNFDAESPITATNQQMPPGYKLYVNFDFKNNIKLTYYEDLLLFQYYLRTGNV